MTRPENRRPLHSVATAIAIALAAPAAFSQQPASTEPSMSEVTVTGSRIRRQDLDGVGPVTVLDREAIAATGATSAEVLLQRMSASAGVAGNQTNAYWTGNGYGTAQVNLRGLGINRTLVLLNGRRVVFGGTGANSAVDLNMIPTSMIERIEVLKDGASALYGADAVAGVVNIITRGEFDGLRFDSKLGQTGEGDGEEYSADMTFGVTGDRGSIVGALSYIETQDVNMADRAPCALADAGDGTLECLGSSSTSGGRATFRSGPNTGQRINFNQVPGGDGNSWAVYNPAVHNIPYFQWLNAVNPIEKTTFSLFGKLNVTAETRFFSELIFSQRESNQIATPGTLQNYFVSGQGRIPFDIPANHPSNPTGQAIRLERRRLIERGPREFFQDVETWRAVFGFEGSLGEKWNWDIAYNKGRNTGEDGSTNVANLDRVYQTIFNCNNTTIPCADYLGVGDISPATLDYILYTQRDTGGNEQESFSLNFTGSLFDLPAGTVSLATGLEHRTESGWRNPDPFVVANIANTNQQDPISGEYEVDEAYAEVVLPLLKDLPAIRNLELNLAARYSDYDLFGNDTNYKIGLLWQAMDGLKFRATKATAFRIPNIPELFGGVAEGNLTTSDPCSNWAALPADSVVRANCQAAGVPTSYRQLGNTILTTVGGNSALQPEDADTFTVGVVYEPSFIGNLAVTLDYWEIDLEDSIQQIPGSEKLAICFNSANLSHPFCGPEHVRRDTLTGDINFLSAQPSNIGLESVSGIDLGVRFAREIAGLGAQLSWNVSYLDQYDVTPFVGGETIEYAGMITGGRGSYTKWRSDASLGVSAVKWFGSYSLQYIGGADDINVDEGPGSHVGSVVYHNVQGGYRITDQLQFAAGVDNLFDKAAPYVASWTDANTDTLTYDLLGRRWYLKLTWNLE